MWKQHGLILTDNCLYYFEYMMDKESRGVIPLKNLSIRKVGDSQKRNYFELYICNNKEQLIKACKTQADGWIKPAKHRQMVGWLRETTWCTWSWPHAEVDQWIKSIQAAVNMGPFQSRWWQGRSGFMLTKTSKSPAPWYPPHYLVQMPTPGADGALRLWILVPCLENFILAPCSDL